LIEIILYPGCHQNKNAIYLSPLCFVNEINYKDFDFLDLDIDKIKSDFYLRQIEKYIDENLESITKNAFPEHYNFFPLHYWRRILYSQIFYSTSLIFKIEKMFELISNQDFLYKIKVLNKNQIYPFKDFNIYEIDGFNLFKITSLILLEKKFDKIKLLPFTNSHLINKNTTITHNIFQSIKQRIFNSIQFLLKNVKMGYGINVLDSIILQIKLPRKKSKKIEFKPKSENKLNSKIDWRLNLIMELISSDFKKTLSNYLNRFKSGSFRHNNKVKLVQNTLFADFKELIISNLGSLNGQLIIPSQHGGDLFYNNDLFKKNLEKTYNYYISWRKRSNSCEQNILFLPSPLFSKVFDTYNQLNNNVILVGTQIIKFNAGFDGWFINSKEVFRYRESKIQLINFLLNRETANFFYRPYFSSPKNALPDYKFFKKIFPELRIIKSNLHNEIKNCKLLIMDHPGTTLSLALSMNVPFLLYFEDMKYFGIDKSSPMINKFIELNILFTDLNKFKKHYNTIIDDPQSWWKSIEMQDLRNFFLDKYAFCDKKWRSKWIQQLKEI
tara:strand:- start:1419 stop:3080 length:1662 start_codon:yes stop_codon:yes gene_type:complete